MRWALGVGRSDTYGVNGKGRVTGQAVAENGGYRAFLYSNGTMTDLSAVNGVGSIGWEINDAGEVVGQNSTASGVPVAFLYSGGHMVDLNTLLPSGSAWIVSGAYALNDNGQIAGYGTITGSGQQDAVLMTPVPPAAWLLASGLLGLVGMARRKIKQTEAGVLLNCAGYGSRCIVGSALDRFMNRSGQMGQCPMKNSGVTGSFRHANQHAIHSARCEARCMLSWAAAGAGAISLPARWGLSSAERSTRANSMEAAAANE